MSVVGDTELETPILDKKENEFEVFNEEENLELENQIFAELATEEEKQNDIFRTREGDLNYSKDTVLEHINQIKETNITPAEISFNAFDSFLPDVKFSVPAKSEELAIQEITPEEKVEISSEKDINFSQIQEFEIKQEPIFKQEIAPANETKEEEEVIEIEEKNEIIEVKVIEKKAEIIDKFIEENPKISQLKEEVNFVVKEKNDDISHLMTETLAKLYTEQRLYTKAIKAYEILQNKHPERAEDFKAKIQEIKDLKQGK
jgi:hypothetical protein